jgi:hypothetical protein
VPDLFVDWWGDRLWSRVEPIVARHGLALHRATPRW